MSLSERYKKYRVLYYSIIALSQIILLLYMPEACANADMREAEIRAQMQQKRHMPQVQPVQNRSAAIETAVQKSAQRVQNMKPAAKGAASAKQVTATLPAVRKTPAAKEHMVLAGAEANAHGVLNGYKGYRYRRAGYKTTGDGWWYPRAAFSAGTAKDTVKLPFMGKNSLQKSGNHGFTQNRGGIFPRHLP